MSPLAARRWFHSAISILLVGLSAVVYRVGITSFSQTRFYEVSGWVLFGLLLALALFTIRKKLPFLPLFTAASWLQVHLYAGVLSVVLFLGHIKMAVPNGTLEIGLTVLFLLVVGSGLVGWGLSRIIPKRLTTRGSQVIYERIPEFRKRLGERAASVVEQAIEDTGTATIPDFHAKRLIAFFAGPQNFWPHLFQSNRPRVRLSNELAAMDRYLNDVERTHVGELSQLVQFKDDLDYQYAHQTMLKYWLFVHIPLTYSLLMVALVHGILMLAYYSAFRGGAG